ncbi:MAG: secondary thiamine-phosphate synthase enzyme YjbQ [Anaerolineales bacterium]
MVHSDAIQIHTQGHGDAHDLTRQVETIVSASGVHSGVVVVHTPSSTSALTTIEYEPGALDDLKRALDEIVPTDREYLHNLAWGDGNGHAHVKAALLGPSISLPVLSGKIALGTWQQILFLDFDVRPRQREIIVQVVGEQGR